MVSTPSPRVSSSFLTRVLSIGIFCAVSLAAEAQISISITPINELAFGTFAAGNGGTVAVAASGDRIVDGPIDLAAPAGNGAATFEIHGEPNTAYSISLGSSITLHRSSGTETMTITDFETNPQGAGLLDGAGMQLLSVGATLHVAADQRPGAYGGSFEITIDYQ